MDQPTHRVHAALSQLAAECLQEASAGACPVRRLVNGHAAKLYTLAAGNARCGDLDAARDLSKLAITVQARLVRC